MNLQSGGGVLFYICRKGISDKSDVLSEFMWLLTGWGGMWIQTLLVQNL